MPFFVLVTYVFMYIFLMFFRYSVYCGCYPFKEENFGVLLYEENEGHWRGRREQTLHPQLFSHFHESSLHRLREDIRITAC